MKRDLALLLAVVLCLMLAGCWGAEIPSPGPGVESSAVLESPAVRETAQENGSDWESALIVSPGVEVKAAFTWNSEERWIDFGPRCGDLQLFFQIIYATQEKSLLGFDLETEEAAGFELPLSDKTNIWAVPGGDGEFILFDGIQRRHFGWKGGRLQEYPPYTLPEPVQGRVIQHSYQNWPPITCQWQTYDPWTTDYYWDALPEKDLLAWCQEDGVWLSDADGVDARLVLSQKEVFSLPDLENLHDRDMERFLDSGFSFTELLRDPRLLNGGNTLLAGAYSDADLSYPRAGGYLCGYVVLDIPTGKTSWHYTGPYFPLSIIDDTTVLFRDKTLDLSTGAEERRPTQHGCTSVPWDYSVSADAIHFFGCFTPYNGDYSDNFFTYRLDEKDWEQSTNTLSEYYTVLDSLNKRGLVTLLLKMDHDDWYLHGTYPAIDAKRSFCLCSSSLSAPEAKDIILLVTAPDQNERRAAL